MSAEKDAAATEETKPEVDSAEETESTEEVAVDDGATDSPEQEEAKAEAAGDGAEKQSDQPEATAKPAVSTAKQRILLVEDSIPLCRMVEKLLVSSGYEVTIASNGVEGLKAFDAAKEPFALLIIDIMMPEMDGIQMIAHLRKKGVSQLPPMIICSSRSDAETVKLTLKLGAAAYILKPFTTEIVLGKIKEVIGL